MEWDYESYYHEKLSAKIEEYQNRQLEKIEKIIRDAYDKLATRDYEEFLKLVKDLMKEY